MPRKKKPAKSTAMLLDEAIRDLEEAKARVAFYSGKLHPLHQQLIAEMAALYGPLERPDDVLRLGDQPSDFDESGPPVIGQPQTARIG